MVREHVEQELDVLGNPYWPKDGPFRVEIVFVFAPNRWKRLGDLDNYGKAVLDACKGLLWIDDSIRYIPKLELSAEADIDTCIDLSVTYLESVEQSASRPR